MTAQTQNHYAVLPSDPASRKKIMDALVEISNSMTRIEGEKSYIKESIKMVADEFDVQKSLIAKLARFYHKQNAKEEKAKAEELFEAFEVLTGEDLEG